MRVRGTGACVCVPVPCTEAGAKGRFSARVEFARVSVARVENLAVWYLGFGRREELEALSTTPELERLLDACEADCLRLLGDFAEPAESPVARRVLLNLLAEDEQGHIVRVANGAELRLRAWPGNNSLLDLRRVFPVEMTFRLHTDIFVPLLTHRALARRNGGRLTAFLHRLRVELGAEVFGI